MTFKATLKGKYAKAEYLHWYANGEEVVDAAGRTKVTVLVNDEMLNSTYQIYAVLQYNGSSVASNPLVISVGGVEAGSGSSSASSSGSSSSGGTSSGASSGSGTGSDSGAGAGSGSTSSGNGSSVSGGSDSTPSGDSSAPEQLGRCILCS